MSALIPVCDYAIILQNGKSGGGFMKKFASIFFFILAIATFLLDLFGTIAGAIDVKNQLAELAARGAGGHELLGVGLDVLVFATVLISIAGFIAALVSWRIAQYRTIRIMSCVLCPLFLLPIFTCAMILAL